MKYIVGFSALGYTASAEAWMACDGIEIRSHFELGRLRRNVKPRRDHLVFNYILSP
jgi:hypothetical protein